MSELERRWLDCSLRLSTEDVVKLVETLRKERDCWLDNAKAFEKENQRLQKELAGWQDRYLSHLREQANAMSNQ